MFIFSINIEEVWGGPDPFWRSWQRILLILLKGNSQFQHMRSVETQTCSQVFANFCGKKSPARETRLCFTLQVIQLYKFQHSYMVSDCKRKTWHKTSGINVVNEGFGKTNRVINELMWRSGSRAKGAVTFTTNHQLLFFSDQRHFHCPALQKKKSFS